MFFSVDQILDSLYQKLGSSQDVYKKTIAPQGKRVGIIFLRSMIDKELFTRNVLVPIIETKEKISLNTFKEKVFTALEIEKVETEQDYIKKIVENNALIFVEGEEGALAIDFEKFPERMPSEPPTSAVIHGPREGFTENVKTNITLLRRRFKTQSFRNTQLEIGEYTKTKVSIVYLEGIANKKVVKEVIKVLSSIKIDGVIDSHYLLSFLQDEKEVLFKEVGVSEKPDIVGSKLLEGKVAILCDGSPIVLTVPYTVLEDLQNSNDYYTNPLYASFIRVIRALGILLASIVPGVYLSLRLFHYKILPLKFLITISNATQNLPFTPFLELLFILILFQILYEVSLRLPRYLGLATSIVGALILGDTGVKAGLISTPGVVIIAMSIISIYVVPDQAPQLTVLRFIFLILGGTLGLFGIVGGMIYFINRLASLNGFGTPTLAPFAPRIREDLKDGVAKVPVYDMTTRPKSYNNKNKVRLKK